MDGRDRTDGWMNGRMDGWMDGWMHGWMDGWMDGHDIQSAKSNIYLREIDQTPDLLQLHGWGVVLRIVHTKLHQTLFFLGCWHLSHVGLLHELATDYWSKAPAPNP